MSIESREPTGSNGTPPQGSVVRPPWLPRWVRGVHSASLLPVVWLGRFCGFRLQKFRTPDRYRKGLAIVLPGIESQSFLGHSVVRGLADGGWQGAIEIYDWTTTCTLFFLFHLRSWKRNLRQARLLAQRIEVYRRDFPDSPVHLIGHSGGGAIAVLALEALSEDCCVTSAVLLAPALSRRYPLERALSRTKAGIWNFWSPLDVIFLGAGTLLFGTIDGRWQLSAGMIGFRPEPVGGNPQGTSLPQLHQVPYTVRMARGLNFGGHFGPTNRAFVEQWVAPILAEADGRATS